MKIKSVGQLRKVVGQLRKVVRQTYNKKRIHKDLVSLYKQNPDASAFELKMKLKKKYIKEVNVKAKPLGYKAYLDKEHSGRLVKVK